MSIINIKNIKNLRDDELISSFRRTGKTRFFNEIYRRYYHLVYGVCLNILKNEDDAKDIMTQIFEKLIIILKKEEITYFKTWLHSVTRNECLMKLRSQSRENNRAEKYFLEYEPEKHIDEFSFEKDDLDNRLDDLNSAINNLKFEQKQCIILFYFEKKCYNQIAELTGLEIGLVKSHIQNGKRNLRLMLTENKIQRTV